MQTRTPMTAANLTRALQMIWGALLFASGLYVYVAVTILAKAASSSDFFPDFSQPAEIAVTASAIASFVFAMVLPRLVFSKKARAEKLFTTKIVTFALCEMTVLTGFVMTILTHSNRVIFPFFALGVIAFLANRPSDAETKSLLLVDET